MTTNTPLPSPPAQPPLTQNVETETPRIVSQGAVLQPAPSTPITSPLSKQTTGASAPQSAGQRLLLPLLVAALVLTGLAAFYFVRRDSNGTAVPPSNSDIAQPPPTSGRGLETLAPSGELIARWKSAVVLIESYAFKGNDIIHIEGKTSQGTGFFVSADGLIATAHHVIRQVDDGLDHRIAVKLLDTSKFEQVLCLAEDKENDLAVIKIAKQGTEYLRLSSTDSIPQTTRIFVIGHPGKGTYSEFWSVTQGSVTSRAIGPDEKEYYGVDARIEPGNSGGPVLLTGGEVIGVADWKVTATSMNYAVPVQKLRTLIERSKDAKGSPCGIGGKMTW
ncbi:MAG: trypsin-like peptidase domain-containing protein [Polyangiaceae bacterium]|nr:trypsin-like peptidase domain-containing protein [Polyangiaceae bacterium]